MKKTLIHRSLAAAILFAASPLALAASHNVDGSDGSGKEFDQYLSISSSYKLMDSTRKKEFDFLDQTVHLGLDYKKGPVTAVFLAQYEGNSNGFSSTGSNGTYTVNGANSDSYTLSNAVGIRKAYLGFDLLRQPAQDFNLVFGRYIPTGAATYGNNAITSQWSISGFSPVDGAALAFNSEVGSSTLDAMLSFSTAMPVSIYSSTQTHSGMSTADVFGFDIDSGSTTVGTGNNGFSSNSKSDKAIILSLAGSTNVGPGQIEGRFAYGMQHDASYNVTNITDGSQNADTSRDTAQLEVSVGYGYQYMKGGAWFTQTTLGETKYASEVSGNEYTYTNGNNLKDHYYIAGVGIQGDSRQFGLQDVMYKGGLMTFGAGVQRFMHRQFGTNAIIGSKADDSDVTLLSFAPGFSIGGFKTELDVAFFQSNSAKVFSGHSGLQSSSGKNSANMVYLVTAFEM